MNLLGMASIVVRHVVGLWDLIEEQFASLQVDPDHEGIGFR